MRKENLMNKNTKLYFVFPDNMHDIVCVNTGDITNLIEYNNFKFEAEKTYLYVATSAGRYMTCDYTNQYTELEVEHIASVNNYCIVMNYLSENKNYPEVFRKRKDAEDYIEEYFAEVAEEKYMDYLIQMENYRDDKDYLTNY